MLSCAGNAYRIVVWINYPYRVVYLRFVGTHRNKCRGWQEEGLAVCVPSASRLW